MSARADQAAERAAALASAYGVAADLPAILLEARRTAAGLVPGLHRRRQAGAGDSFWQYRELATGESARLIDWRRSARSDRLFVREREREAPARLQVWADLRPGMRWRGAEDRPDKAARALALALALGIAARSGGEQVVALGAGRIAASEGALSDDLIRVGCAAPLPPGRGAVLVVTDGLGPLDIWAAWTGAARAQADSFAVCLLHDPHEEDFPYSGRTRFTAPGGGEPVVVGRAEAARSGFKAAWQGHRGALETMVREAGGALVRHRTDAPALGAALALAAALDPRNTAQEAGLWAG